MSGTESEAIANWNDRRLTGIAQALANGERFVVTTHISPDGDAIGSAKAMEEMLRQLGKEVWLYHAQEVPSAHSFLGTGSWKRNLPDDLSEWTAVVLDCASFDRAGEPRLTAVKQMLVIDHHATNPGYGDLNCVRPECAATCEILIDLADQLEVMLNEPLARALYTGVWTDTGKLRYTNVTERTEACIERLGEALGGHEEVVSLIDYRPDEWVAYAEQARSNVRFLGEGTVALTYLPLTALRAAGVADRDAKEAGNICTDTVYWDLKGKVELVALVYDLPTGSRSVSLRAYDSEHFHAGEIAAELGGGGHRAAAGFTTTLSVDEIGEQVYRRFIQQAEQTVTPEIPDSSPSHSL